MRTEKRTGNSISSRLRRLMMILVPLSALYIGISVASTYYFKKQIVSYADVAFRAKCKMFSRHLQKPILKTEKGRFKGL